MEPWAAASTEPVGYYTPHAAPMQLAFYTGEQFPEEYRGDAFVAMRGSWNRKPPSGYEVLRVRFEDGEPVAFEPFVTGFLMQTEEGRWGHLGRLAGLAMAADGALLLADDTNGVIYRISFERSATAERSGPGEPTNVAGARVGMSEQVASVAPPADTPAKLATDLLDAQQGTLEVTSPAFKDGEAIPLAYAAEQHNISPPVSWSAGPDGTLSYVLMLEDSEVEQDAPFVHWTIYNIPADQTALREGVPGRPRLVLPDGTLQGRNDKGSTGYTGMRPPVGDPPHHYHLQVFALDSALTLPHGASRADLLEAMKGHVLAKGELVGTFQRT
jgi:Raf kinase inhibitor-like YbhB/YbcL family protein